MSAHDDDIIRGRALPEPALKLTIPSIHDNLTLDCRVYHPASLTSSGKATQWHKDAAIVAHPYAPMGGSYKDPIVDVIASTLLRLGYLVCTFNFRGAPGSAGRTSWTAKAERADYMSVIGFVSHYVHYLDPMWRPDTREGPADPDTHGQRVPVLLLAGYSYGAMITMQLPKLDTILSIFEAPEHGSAAAEIHSRAEHLAVTQNTILGACARAVGPENKSPERSPRKSMGLRVGGDEDLRRSHELPRRSFSVGPEERYRTFVARTRRRHQRTVSSDSVLQKNAVMPAGDHDAPNRQAEVDEPQSVLDMTPFRPAYLLVSPLRGMITHLASMSYSNMFGIKTTKSENDQPPKLVVNAAKNVPLSGWKPRRNLFATPRWQYTEIRTSSWRLNEFVSGLLGCRALQDPTSELRKSRRLGISGVKVELSTR